MSKRAPIVAIIGRTNVGKSSLFNALLGRREAIVADEPGTTRDSITARLSLGEQDAWLVDTAGIKTAEDDFELTIQEQISEAAATAELIIVVTEANVPFTEEDRRVATMALKSKKLVYLVVNKADKAKKAPATDYLGLGIKPVILTSITQKKGLDELLERLERDLPAASIKEDSNRVKVAILGRPNAGKSALFNALAKKQQAVVADRAGTTRDINRTAIKFEKREIEFMDTAGIRRSGKIGRGVEYFSVLRTLSAIEQADICLLLMDANELNSHLDQRIAGMVKDAGKGLVIVISKWDSIDKDAYTRDSLAPSIIQSFEFVPWAPLVFTSSVTGQNVTKIYELALSIAKARDQRFKTADLNRWLRQAVDRHPPAGLKNRQPKLNYITQETDNPIPAFKVFGSHTKFLHWSYKRYLDKEFRRQWNMDGTPIQFWFIEKHVDRHKSSS